MDVAVVSGKVAEIAADLPKDRAKKVIDAVGKLATPGLIDIHLHLDGVLAKNGIAEPDQVGSLMGVTCICDGEQAESTLSCP